MNSQFNFIFQELIQNSICKAAMFPIHIYFYKRKNNNSTVILFVALAGKTTWPGLGCFYGYP